MAIYSKSALMQANACLSVLQNDMSDSVNLSNAIDGFCGNSTNNLKGQSWDLIRTNLNDYISVLDLRKNSLNSLIDAIKSANNNLINALGDYPEIDTGNLEEQQAVYNQCVKNINDLEGYNNSDDNTLNKYKVMLSEASKYINQIKEVQSAEQSSLAILEQTGNELLNYNTKVNDICVPVISYAEQA